VSDGVHILFNFNITSYGSLRRQRLCIVTIVQNTWMRCQAKCRVCFKCYSKWATNGWNNVIWQCREGTSSPFKIDMGTEFDPCAHHAAATTVATSFMI